MGKAMADPRFFEVAGPFTAQELAEAANAALAGPARRSMLPAPPTSPS
jgi:UDP-3-O-[3-hydroxymyristoyl] glucosamine N-acyltransferase